MRTVIAAAGLAVVFLGVFSMNLLSSAFGKSGLSVGASSTPSDDDPKSIYDFKVKSIDGQEVELSKFKGKTILVVNVASRCGYTRQYADMQAAYEKFKDRGFVILGFPCNQFGGQEPGTEEEILEFCSTNYGVEFPMFSKIEVKGEGADPLYKYLTKLATKPKEAGEISWNFEKFLINAEGEVVGRYRSAVSPTSDEMVALLEEMLPPSKE